MADTTEGQGTRGTLRRFASFAQSQAHEYRYWHSRRVHERLAAVSELSVGGYRKARFRVIPDFEDLLSHLNAEGARHLIAGAYAVGVHAQPRATKGRDIFIGPDSASGEAVWRALAKFGAPVAGRRHPAARNGRTLRVFYVYKFLFDLTDGIIWMTIKTGTEKNFMRGTILGLCAAPTFRTGSGPVRAMFNRRASLGGGLFPNPVVLHSDDDKAS